MKEGEFDCVYPNPFYYMGEKGDPGEKGVTGVQGKSCNADSRESGDSRDMRTCCKGNDLNGQPLKGAKRCM